VFRLNASFGPGGKEVFKPYVVADHNPPTRVGLLPGGRAELTRSTAREASSTRRESPIVAVGSSA
jgi:hypothetical protein